MRTYSKHPNDGEQETIVGVINALSSAPAKGVDTFIVTNGGRRVQGLLVETHCWVEPRTWFHHGAMTLQVGDQLEEIDFRQIVYISMP